MRRTCDQNGGIGNDKTAYLVRALVWIDHVHGLVLLHPVYDVVAVDEAESKLTARHQIGAIAVARR